MKKNIFLIFLISAFAQLTFAQKSFFGVNAGTNLANQRSIYNAAYYYNTTGSEFFKNALKPTFGLFYQSNLSGTTGVRIAAQYMGLGYKSRSGSQYDVNINYLTFPLSFHYRPSKNISLNLGSYLSFTLHNTKVRVANQNNPVSVASVYNDNDTGFFLGGEYSIHKDFALAVNYYIGTKNIWLNDNNGAVKYNNRALQFTLIYKFKKFS